MKPHQNEWVAPSSPVTGGGAVIVSLQLIGALPLVRRCEDTQTHGEAPWVNDDSPTATGDPKLLRVASGARSTLPKVDLCREDLWRWIMDSELCARDVSTR